MNFLQQLFAFWIALCLLQVCSIIALVLFFMCNKTLWKGMKSITQKLTSYSSKQIAAISIYTSLFSGILGGYVSYRLFFQHFAYAWIWISVLLLCHFGELFSLVQYFIKSEKQ